MQDFGWVGKEPEIPDSLGCYLHAKGPFRRGDVEWHGRFWSSEAGILLTGGRPEGFLAWMEALDAAGDPEARGMQALAALVPGEGLAEALADAGKRSESIRFAIGMVSETAAVWMAPSEGKETWGKSAFAKGPGPQEATRGLLGHVEEGLSRRPGTPFSETVRESFKARLSPGQQGRARSAEAWAAVLEKAGVCAWEGAADGWLDGLAQTVAAHSGKGGREFFLRVFGGAPGFSEKLARAAVRALSLSVERAGESFHAKAAASSEAVWERGMTDRMWAARAAWSGASAPALVSASLKRDSGDVFLAETGLSCAEFAKLLARAAPSGKKVLNLAIQEMSSLSPMERSRMGRDVMDCLWLGHLAGGATVGNHVALSMVDPAGASSEWAQAAQARFKPEDLAAMERLVMDLDCDTVETPVELEDWGCAGKTRRPSL